jgi:hypothetical protein
MSDFLSYMAPVIYSLISGRFKCDYRVRARADEKKKDYVINK